MSSDINRVLVLDDRLHCTDQISYGVQKGAQSVTYSQFNAVSATTNQINFNVQVPSQESLLSRDIYIQATLTFTISVPPAVGSLASAVRMIYGKTDALAPFPLHQCIMSMNTTINNNTITINTKDVLPVILRLMSPEDLAKFEATCPVLPDMFMDYNDAVDFNDYAITSGNVRDAAGTATTPAFIPVANATGLIDANATTATSYHANPLGSAMDSHFNGLKGRGAFKLLSVLRTGGGGTNAEVFTVKVQVTEPLLMSPWIFRGLTQHNGQAMYGIQNMNIQITLDPTAKRAWRYANGIKGVITGTDANGFPNVDNSFKKSVALTGIDNCKLLMCILTAPPSLLLPAKNIVPYYELPLYRTTISTNLPAATVNTQDGSINYNYVQITSNSLQLSNIPDALIIFIRKKNLTNRDTDHFACIQNISVQFDNVAGILVNAQQEDLWRMSVENGLKMSWEEFSGGFTGMARPFSTVVQRNRIYSPGNNINSTYPWAADFAAADADAQARRNYLEEIGVPSFSTIAGAGSILVLEMGKDIPLQEFYAPGSLGSFNLQITLKVYNQSLREDFVSGNYELCVITKNSGILVNERGTTSVYLGLLTKQDVLSTSEQEPYKKSDVKRLVGGGWFDNLKTNFFKILPKLPSVAKSVLSHFRDDHHLAKTAHDVLDHLGYGKHKGKGNHKSIDDHLM